jgi:hypothetical protein
VALHKRKNVTFLSVANTDDVEVSGICMLPF